LLLLSVAFSPKIIGVLKTRLVHHGSAHRSFVGACCRGAAAGGAGEEGPRVVGRIWAEELEEEKELFGGLGQRKCWGYMKNMRRFSATTERKCSSTQLGCCCCCCCQKMARDDQ